MSTATPLLTIDAVVRRPRPLGRVASARRRSSVVLALFEQGRPTASLLRAAALARILDAELRVLRVLSGKANAPTSGEELDAVLTEEGRASVSRLSQRWLCEVLHDAQVAERFEVVQGDFVDCASSFARELGASLIVVPPRTGRLGSTVTSLASAAGVPVLVARGGSHDETIVAATDLASSDYPVLKKAAELGRLLDAPVVALHNLSPVTLVPGMELAFSTAMLLAEPDRSACRAQLKHAARGLPVHAESVVRAELDPAEAILREARSHDADLVVVGSRPKSFLARLMKGSVAADVVNRARRSVLVLPLPSPAEAAA